MQAAAREALPGALVLPVGFAVLILAGELATLSGATAGLAGPFVVVLAIAGLLLAPPWPLRAWGWPAAAATATYAVYAAPIVLSGQATFGGYIKLDDTATYFAMTDRVMSHARSLAGLAPSTYEATLATTIKTGYPTGSLMPLGIGHQLTGYDIAWLYQPYLTFMAALLALGLYAVLERTIPSPPLRAVASFIAAQPAILVGYALWGGIKELAGAWLLVTIATLVPWTLGARRSALAAIPLAAVCAALVCVLSLPGGLWLLPALVAASLLIALRPERALLERAGVFAAALCVLAIPAFVASVSFLGEVSNYSKGTELGNLIPPGLSKLQLFGIWPGGDFRLRHDPAQVKVLIALVIAAAAVGVWWAWRRESWALLLYVATAGIGCALYLAVGSPWVGGKTLAMAAPAFLAAAFAACAWAVRLGQVVPAAVVALAIGGGVLWSNWDQYHDVWLAPRGQLHELETIGHRIAGQGPTLMTDYQVYGARHFLRSAILRRRRAAQALRLPDERAGAAAEDALGGHRPLPARRHPRLPHARPAARARFRAGRPRSTGSSGAGATEVWQRARAGAEHDRRAPRPEYVEPARAGSGMLRSHAAGEQPGVVSLAAATRPQTIWLGAPPLSGERDVTVSIPKDGEYFAWLGGDWYGDTSISVDGHEVGSRREELNWPRAFTPELGRTRLAAGQHVVTIRHATGGWRAGSGAVPYSFGPAALSPVDDRPEPFRKVPVSRAQSLCGQRLDWVEALR